MRIRSKRLWLGVAAFVAIGAGVALATGDIWGSYFDPTVSKSLFVELRNTSDNSLDQRIDVTRGPVDPVTNMTLVSVTLTLQQPGVTLNSMSLKVGNDTNQDGAIQPSELTTVATGSITSQGGTTTATISNVPMPTNKDCFRVCYNRSDIGDHYDEIFSTNISHP